MPNTNPKQLVVESPEDLHVIVGLMQHHTDWPNNANPVNIEYAGNCHELLKRDFLSAKLKQSGLSALGIVVDADEVFEERWQSMRESLLSFGYDTPEEFPKGGLIAEQQGFARCGVWIMPDNARNGMLETFCEMLIPVDKEASWEYAAEAVSTARERGAPWREVHEDKARIHTWLAWQAPPGERLGIAMRKNVRPKLSKL